MERAHTITRNDPLKPSETIADLPHTCAWLVVPSLLIIYFSQTFHIFSLYQSCTIVFNVPVTSKTLVKAKLRTNTQTTLSKGSFSCGNNSCVRRRRTRTILAIFPAGFKMSRGYHSRCHMILKRHFALAGCHMTLISCDNFSRSETGVII